MELVVSQKATGNFLWAAACGMLGLLIGLFHLLGILLLVGSVIFAVKGFRALSGKECLKIDGQGFTICSMFRERRVAWADIEAFKVLTYRYLGLIPYRRMVVFRYIQERRGSAMRKAVGWINGWDEMLPGSYGMKAQALTGLLEQYRQKTAQGQGAQSA